MIQNLKTTTIYPEIISDATGETIDNILEYFGPFYLETALELGQDSLKTRELLVFIDEISDFRDNGITLQYSENLSGKLKIIKELLKKLFTIQVTIESVSHSSIKPMYQCSDIIPLISRDQNLSVTAIKYGNYLQLNFLLYRYEVDSDFIYQLESDLISTQNIDGGYLLNDIFYLPLLPEVNMGSQIITIWSPKEI